LILVCCLVLKGDAACVDRQIDTALPPQVDTALPPQVDTALPPLPENSSQPIGSCTFTRDCQQWQFCSNIADAACVCNLGQCVIAGNPFFRGSECGNFTDCDCAADPATCFCRGGFCRAEQWECHTSQDCATLAKCTGRECACTGNTCEADCNTDADCEAGEFHCNSALGYQCECRASLCEYKRKEEECAVLGDCVAAGRCVADLPCACTQNYCALPWWVENREQELNCRTSQDCTDSILDCQAGDCSCVDLRPIDKWETRGKCAKRPQLPFLPPPPKIQSKSDFVFN